MGRGGGEETVRGKVAGRKTVWGKVVGQGGGEETVWGKLQEGGARYHDIGHDITTRGKVHRRAAQPN